MERILVTGVNGFVGHHLAHELKSAGHYVVGTGQHSELDPALANVVDEYVGDCDLTLPASVEKLPLKDLGAVINLAGLAQVGASFDQSEKYFRINVAVHTVLIEALRRINRGTRIVAISTGAVYDSQQPMPLNEDSMLVSKGSPYALSKVAMETALQDYIDDDMDIIIARPFNHIGPGQGTGFIVPDFAQQVLDSDMVTVGNLATERDFTDVRDVARAYRLLATQPVLNHRVYNVCSGHSLSGQEILDTIVTQAGKPKVTVKVDESRIRPHDPPQIIGDNGRLHTDTGWQPTYLLEQTIRDYLASASKS